MQNHKRIHFKFLDKQFPAIGATSVPWKILKEIFERG